MQRSENIGAAGSLVIAGSYYSALILYFGAEFTRVYACEFGSYVGCDAVNRPRV
jgi:membrane protein